MYPVGKSIRIYVYGLGIVHLFEGQILQMSGGNKTFADVSSSWSVILANIYIYIHIYHLGGGFKHFFGYYLGK